MVIVLDDEFAKKFGRRIKELREAKGLTQEEFCETDEGIEGMTVRNLSRIENGKTLPNLKSFQYLSERFGMSISELLDEPEKTGVVLPQDYLDAKYKIIRTPTYGNKATIAEIADTFEVIYDKFYDDLPEDEQEIVDILQIKFDNYDGSSPSLQGIKIVENNMMMLMSKDVYDLNDLLIVRLYQSQFNSQYVVSEEFDEDFFFLITKKLLASVDYISNEYLFLMRDCLLIIPTIEYLRKDVTYSKQIIVTLRKIMEKTQDFQKKPILLMLEWQYSLWVEYNNNKAEQLYQEAVTLASLLENHFLVKKLTEQWEEDIKVE